MLSHLDPTLGSFYDPYANLKGTKSNKCSLLIQSQSLVELQRIYFWLLTIKRL